MGADLLLKVSISMDITWKLFETYARDMLSSQVEDASDLNNLR